MKAVIKAVVEEENPRLDAVSGASVMMPVIVVEVDYVTDTGDLATTARHAFLPEELTDFTIFDRQAEIMQRDIEDSIRQAQARDEQIARVRPVSEKAEALRQHFKLFKDTIPLGDK